MIQSCSPTSATSRATTFSGIAVALVLFLLGSTALVHSNIVPVLPDVRVSLSDIKSEQGFCFVSSSGSPPLSSHEHPSNARLLENGIELGPSNSQHSDIRVKGGGRFSFWHSSIYFSSSDNTDPRTNGRAYEAVSERILPTWLIAVAWIACLVGLLEILNRTQLGGPLKGLSLTVPVLSLVGSAFIALAVCSNIRTPGLAFLEDALVGDILGYHHTTEPLLEGWDDLRLQRQQGESDLELTRRLNRVVANSFSHCDSRVVSRLIDWLASRIMRRSHEVYGILLPENGCGFCHQSAFILAKALLNQGISASVFGLNGHVVTLVDISNVKWIADPDAGIGPFLYSTTMWSEIRPQYEAFAGSTGSWIEAFESSFAKTDDDASFAPMERLLALEKKQRLIIRGLEVLSWLVGVLGLILVVVGVERRRRYFVTRIHAKPR